jgi:hypothetical protein
MDIHNVFSVLRDYAANRKVAASIPDEVTDLFN